MESSGVKRPFRDFAVNLGTGAAPDMCKISIISENQFETSKKPAMKLSPPSAESSCGDDTSPTHKIYNPKKGEYRQRAHCNPLSDSKSIRYPTSPDHVDWSVHFPHHFNKLDEGEVKLNTYDYPIRYPEEPQDEAVNGRFGRQVEFVDVGCGFGSLLLWLSPRFPDKLILGLEIREKVTNFVGLKIRSRRNGIYELPSSDINSESNDISDIAHNTVCRDSSTSEVHIKSNHDSTQHPFSNVSVIRTNAMKFLVNYFRRHQLEKLFFCFPDPQFKKSNIRRRIITPSLLSVYAFVLKPGGRLYTATDVWDLHVWMRCSLSMHPLFAALDLEETEKDVCMAAVISETDEAKKVIRNQSPIYSAVYMRVNDP